MHLSRRLGILTIVGAAALTPLVAAPAHAQDKAPKPPASIKAATITYVGGGCKLEMWRPYKNGRYLQQGTRWNCRWNGRAHYVKFESRLDQYRGAGIWRNKAKKKKTYSMVSSVYLNQNPSWKCSGGNQKYRNHTYGQRNHNGRPYATWESLRHPKKKLLEVRTRC
ncbi:hypothetical protein SMC26_14740 [Actinomadura fulvescens]|uniref:Uncharacterized protein n=1 Tax=Actinomadura fulvescens TaxID=46160 RepID=A0ABP6D6F3_9ACTN